MIRQLDADLAKHPFVFGMSTQDVGLLADCALKVHFRKGELIFREGEKAEKVYLIESGSVALEACYAPKSRRLWRLIVFHLFPSIRIDLFCDLLTSCAFCSIIKNVEFAKVIACVVRGVR